MNRVCVFLVLTISQSALSKKNIRFSAEGRIVLPPFIPLGKGFFHLFQKRIMFFEKHLSNKPLMMGLCCGGCDERSLYTQGPL